MAGNVASIDVVVALKAKKGQIDKIIEDFENKLADIDPGSAMAKSITKNLGKLKEQQRDFSILTDQQLIDSSDLTRSTKLISNIRQTMMKISSEVDTKGVFSSFNFDESELANLTKMLAVMEEAEKQRKTMSKTSMTSLVGDDADLQKRLKSIKDKADDEKVEIKAEFSFDESDSQIKAKKEEIQEQLQQARDKQAKAVQTREQKVSAARDYAKIDKNTGFETETQNLMAKVSKAFTEGLDPEGLKQRLKGIFEDLLVLDSDGSIKRGKAGSGEAFKAAASFLGVDLTGKKDSAAKMGGALRDWADSSSFDEEALRQKSQDYLSSQKYLEEEAERRAKVAADAGVSDYAHYRTNLTKKIKAAEKAREDEGIATSEVQRLETLSSKMNTLESELAELRSLIEKNLQQREQQASADVKEEKNKLVAGKKSGIGEETEKINQVDAQTRLEESQRKANEAAERENALREQREKEEQENFKKNALQGIKQWMGIRDVVNMAKRGIREAWQDIQKLDKAMTDIAVVTDFSVSDLWGKIDEYMGIAKKYGVTTQGVYEVSQLYYQQGLGESDVNAATTETLKMARIAGMDYKDAADGMTVAIRGFKMEMTDAAHVTDVYSKVAAVTASDTQELVKAMSKTASSAQSVGSEFESTTAMLAVMIEATRESPENIGSAMKSIISRYGELTKEAKVDADGEIIDYNKVDTALKSVGISLKDSQGQFRDFDVVVEELASKWDTLDSVTQRYIATTFAGNRQQSRFLALVGNYERYMEVKEAAENSEDAGLLQYSKTLDSMETKLNTLKTNFQQLYMSIFDGETAGKILDFINDLLAGLNNLSSGKGLGALVTAITPIFSLVRGTKLMAQGGLSFGMPFFSKLHGKGKNTTEAFWGINQGAQGQGKKPNFLQRAAQKTLGIAPQQQQQSNASGVVTPAVSTAGPGSSTAQASFQGTAGTPAVNVAVNVNVNDNDDNGGQIAPNAARPVGTGMQPVVQGQPGQLYSPGAVMPVLLRNNKNPQDYLMSGNAWEFKTKNGKIEQAPKLISPHTGEEYRSKRTQDFFTGTRTGRAWEQARADGMSAFSWGTGKGATVGRLTSVGGAIAGAVLSGIGTNLAKDNLKAGHITSGIGEMAQFASLGAALGPLGAAVGALVGFVKMIKTMPDDLAIAQQKLEKAQEENEKAQLKRAEDRNKTSGIEATLEKLEKLKKEQYDSAEAQQAYIDANKTALETYPELISSFDAANNAIVDLTSAEEYLNAMRQQTAQSTREAADTEMARVEADLAVQREQKKQFVEESEKALALSSPSTGEEVAFSVLSSASGRTSDTMVFLEKNADKSRDITNGEGLTYKITGLGSGTKGSATISTNKGSGGKYISSLDTDSKYLNELLSDATEGVSRTKSFLFDLDAENQREIIDAFAGIEDPIKYIQTFSKMYYGNESFRNMLGKDFKLDDYAATINGNYDSWAKLLEDANNYANLDDSQKKLFNATLNHTISQYILSYKDDQKALGIEENVFDVAGVGAFFQEQMQQQFVAAQKKDSDLVWEDWISQVGGVEGFIASQKDSGVDYQGFMEWLNRSRKLDSYNQLISDFEAGKISETDFVSQYNELLGNSGFAGENAIGAILRSQATNKNREAGINLTKALMEDETGWGSEEWRLESTGFYSQGVFQQKMADEVFSNIPEQYYNAMVAYSDEVSKQVEAGVISKEQGAEFVQQRIDLMNAIFSSEQLTESQKNELAQQIGKTEWTNTASVLALQQFADQQIGEGLFNFFGTGGEKSIFGFDFTQLPVNLVTAYGTFKETLSEDLENMTSDLEKATKGIDNVKDLTSFLEKYDLALEDMIFSDGKWLVRDVSKISDQHRQNREEQMAQLEKDATEATAFLTKNTQLSKTGKWFSTEESVFGEELTNEGEWKQNSDYIKAYYNKIASIDMSDQKEGGDNRRLQDFVIKYWDEKDFDAWAAERDEKGLKVNIDDYWNDYFKDLKGVTMDALLTLEEYEVAQAKRNNVIATTQADMNTQARNTNLASTRQSLRQSGFQGLSSEEASTIVADLGLTGKEEILWRYNSLTNTYDLNIAAMEQTLDRETTSLKALGENAKKIANSREGYSSDVVALYDSVKDEISSQGLVEGSVEWWDAFNEAVEQRMQENADKIDTLYEGWSATLDNVYSKLTEELTKLTDGLSGTLSNADYAVLQQQYDLENAIFRTSDGVELSDKAAKELITKQYQGISEEAKQFFGKELWESMSGSEDALFGGYQDVENEIAGIQEDLASDIDGNAFKEKWGIAIESASDYLEVLRQIRHESMFDENAYEFTFMEQDATGGLTKNFDNFVGQIDKVKSALQGLQDNEEMSYNDFYNIVDFLGKSGQWENVANQLGIGVDSIEDFATTVVSASETIGKVDAKGFAALGIDISTATSAMSEGMNESLKETARSQIKYLSGIEKMLMALQALEAIGDVELGLGISINVDGGETELTLDKIMEYWDYIKSQDKEKVEQKVQFKLEELGKTGLNDLFEGMGLGNDFVKAFFGEDGVNLNDEAERYMADAWGEIVNMIPEDVLSNMTEGQSTYLGQQMFDVLSGFMEFDENTKEYIIKDKKGWIDAFRKWINGEDFSDIPEALNAETQAQINQSLAESGGFEIDGNKIKVKDFNPEEGLTQDLTDEIVAAYKAQGVDVADIEVDAEGYVTVKFVNKATKAYIDGDGGWSQAETDIKNGINSIYNKEFDFNEEVEGTVNVKANIATGTFTVSSGGKDGEFKDAFINGNWNTTKLKEIIEAKMGGPISDLQILGEGEDASFSYKLDIQTPETTALTDIATNVSTIATILSTGLTLTITDENAQTVLDEVKTAYETLKNAIENDPIKIEIKAKQNSADPQSQSEEVSEESTSTVKVQAEVDMLDASEIAKIISEYTNAIEKINSDIPRIQVRNSVASTLDVEGIAERLRTQVAEINARLGGVAINIPVKGGSDTLGVYTGTMNSITGPAYADGSIGRLATGAQLANKTLVGELGPELAVYNGQYHLLGQTGAEFVKLPKNAIVFNHLQTAGILSGQMKDARGLPLEPSSALATGNVTGPAMAGGGIGAALSAVRRAKSVWQGLLNSLSAADLLGGGGGGGGGGGNDLKAHIADLQEWYNLSRKIADVEQRINKLLAERELLTDGHAYLRNLRETQALLEDQVNTQEDLLKFQELQLKRQAEHINTNDLWSKFLHVDENGLLQYNEGNETNGGKGALQVLQEMNEMSGEQQTAYLASIGYTYTDNDGNALEGSELVAKFYEELQKQIDDYDALRDTVSETETALLELEAQINEIEQEIRQNEIDLSQEIYDIIVDAWKENIENLKEQNELIKEANDAYAEGIQKAIDAERQTYEESEAIADREQLQRQLSLLRRSGGSAAEIANLEQQLDDTLKDEYFRNQEKALETIQEANERQVKLMEEQVKLQEEALEYQQENGVIWTKVYEVMQGTDAEILAFMQGHSTSFFEQSFLQQEDMLLDWAKKVGIYNEEKARQHAIEEAKQTFNQAWTTDTGKSLKSVFEGATDAEREKWKREYNEQYAAAILDGKTVEEAIKLAQEELYEHLENYKKKKESEANDNNNNNSSNSASGSSSSSGEGKNSSKEETPVKVEKQGVIRYNAWGGRKIIYYPSSEAANASEAVRKLAAAGYTFFKPPIDLHYAKGGLINFTGPAWVDGSKSKPERILSAEQNRILEEGLAMNAGRGNSLKEALSSFASMLDSTIKGTITSITNKEQNSSIIVEPGAVVFNVEQLNDAYDIDELYNDITDRLQNIASRSSGRGVSRR